MARPKHLVAGDARERAELAEAVRSVCVAAALDGYEQASLSGLCPEGAWEAAVSAIRAAPLGGLAERAVAADSERDAGPPAPAESLRDAILHLARRFASPGAPAAGSAAAATGAIAAGLLEWTAAVSARGGPKAFRTRARSIASRGAALQASLGSAAQSDAQRVERWMEVGSEGRARDSEAASRPSELLEAATDSAVDVAARCAQVATLAAEVARDGSATVRHDAAAVLGLAASAAECALALAEQDLRAVADSERARSTKRRIWRTRLLLRRVRPPVEEPGSAEPREDGPGS